jgi:hypothetical protein
MSTQIADVAQKEVETITADETELPVSKKEPRLYRTIWRWHFYAGLIVLPVLITAAITGGLYVFVKELDPLLYPYKAVTVEEGRASYQHWFVDTFPERRD